MQSETADFAPAPPPGELDETYALSLIRVYSPIIILRKHDDDVIHRTRNAQHIALPPEEGRTADPWQKIWWNLDVWLFRCANRQAHRQTSDHNASHPYRGEVQTRLLLSCRLRRSAFLCTYVISYLVETILASCKSVSGVIATLPSARVRTTTYCDQRIDMCVCLYVYPLAYLKHDTSKFDQFL